MPISVNVYSALNPFSALTVLISLPLFSVPLPSVISCLREVSRYVIIICDSSALLNFALAISSKAVCSFVRLLAIYRSDRRS